MGVRSRNISCLMPTRDNDTGIYNFIDLEELVDMEELEELVDLEICQNFSRQPEPPSTEECNTNIPCPVRYLPGSFQEVCRIVYLISSMLTFTAYVYQRDQVHFEPTT